MNSKYLKCDECGDVLDRRPADDFGGNRSNSEARGVFDAGEVQQLLDYAKCLGWTVTGDKHFCPKHPRAGA